MDLGAGLSLAAAVVAACATAWNAALARIVAVETAALRRLQSEGSLIVYLEQHPTAMNALNLVIENAGAGPIYDLKMGALPDWTISRRAKVSDLGLFKKGLELLGPKQAVRTYVALATQITNWEEAWFEVHASYRPALEAPVVSAKFRLDMAAFKHLHRIGTPPLPEIARSVRTLAETVTRTIARGRLRVDTWTEDDRQREWAALEAEIEEEERLAERMSAGQHGEATGALPPLPPESLPGARGADIQVKPAAEVDVEALNATSASSAGAAPVGRAVPSDASR